MEKIFRIEEDNDQYLTESDKKGFRAREIGDILHDVNDRIRDIREKIHSLRDRLVEAKKSKEAHEGNHDAQKAYREIIEDITREMDSFRRPYIDLDNTRDKLEKELKEL